MCLVATKNGDVGNYEHTACARSIKRYFLEWKKIGGDTVPVSCTFRRAFGWVGFICPGFVCGWVGLLWAGMGRMPTYYELTMFRLWRRNLLQVHSVFVLCTLVCHFFLARGLQAWCLAK